MVKHYKINKTRYIGKFGVKLEAGTVVELDDSNKSEAELIQYIDRHYSETFVNVFDKSEKGNTKRVPLAEQLKETQAKKELSKIKAEKEAETEKEKEELKG